MNSFKRETMFAQPIIQLYASLDRYATSHREAYESPIGEDYVMGDHWLAMAAGLLGLLGGETGTLDCGEWDRRIRALVLENGFTAEQADTL